MLRQFAFDASSRSDGHPSQQDAAIIGNDYIAEAVAIDRYGRTLLAIHFDESDVGPTRARIDLAGERYPMPAKFHLLPDVVVKANFLLA